ncbi:MAG TPA: hypothetical protein ENL16_00690 [Candidatus Woesearchaeota archaeon]|nr:hypothetical protein [Candidatus Woesearchaeota archaeon]
MILILDMNHKTNSLGFDEFVTPIIRIVSSLDECEAKHYSELRQRDLAKYDKIILSGTPLRDNAFRDDTDCFMWLRKYNKPVLGISAGMQIIGLVFGCSLMRCKEIGMTRVITRKENKLFSGEFEAYELHTSSIKPCSEFEILADSARCVQAVKHKDKEVYGILFHPEVRNNGVVKNFVKLK